MKKTFYINNYLNQKTNLPSKRQEQTSQLPQSRSQKLDYYEQYLQKHHLQHSQSALPHQNSNSPYKRTMTAETSELSHKPQETARYQGFLNRKGSEQTPKNITTQRIYYDRSNPDKSNVANTSISQLSDKSNKQWQLELEININKLKDIKGYLENEIGQLQRLLDETSQNLQHIDVEFEKIKERVLDYTARSLDAAFRKYKQHMTRWSKYEEVEKKSLEVVLEVRDYIHENQRMLEELRQGNNSSNITNSLREVSNRVEHYQQTTNQLKRVRQECLNRHPTLKEERVLEFERVVEELCCF